MIVDSSPTSLTNRVLKDGPCTRSSLVMENYCIFMHCYGDPTHWPARYISMYDDIAEIEKKQSDAASRQVV